MHEKLSLVFDGCKNPTKASSTTANAQLLPILQAVADIQQQVAIHRGNLLQAELAAPDPDDVRGQVERMYQTLNALDTDLKALVEVSRRVSLSMCQLERYGRDIEQEFLRRDLHESEVGAAGSDRNPPVKP